MIAAANIPLEGRAFLGALYVGESGGDYTILYGGGHFDANTPSKEGYYGFPDWPGKDNSHAAGAPQFQPGTWKDTVEKLFPKGSTPNFRNPADQDWGAWLLAQDVYKRVAAADLLADLKKGTGLSVVAPALQSTWTSLDPMTLPTRYRAAMQQEAAREPQDAQKPPAPTPQPPAPQPPSVRPLSPDNRDRAIEFAKKAITILAADKMAAELANDAIDAITGVDP